MPSNYTEHYSLSQWEAADKVLRSDFNQDNAKLDAALACHPSAELIFSATIEEELFSFQYDVSNFNWAPYLMVILFAEASTPNGFQAFFNVGSAASITISSSAGTSGHSGLCHFPYAYHMMLIIPVLYSGSHPQIALGAGFGSVSQGVSEGALSGGGGGAPLSECTTLSVRRASGSLQPGDKIALWGVK